jgi:hypothetical protein
VIASRNGVIAAWVIAALLGVALLIDTGRQGAPATRMLLPSFDPATVTALAWTGPRKFRIERDPQASTGWRWIDPPGEADRQALEDVLAAVRGAQWHRRAAASVAGAIQASLTLETTTSKTTIGLGDALGEEQRWITIGDDALLVDAWVSRAIAPEPLSLRVQRPLAGVAAGNQIEVGSFLLTGSPRRVTKLAGLPIDLLASAPAVEALEQALRELVVVAIPNGKVPVDTNYRGTRIGVDGKLIAVEAGMCPAPNRDLHAILGPMIGSACVLEARWQAMLAAAAVFDVKSDPAGRQASLAALVERRPVPIEPLGVVLPDGSSLDLAKRPRVKDPKQPAARDADAARVAELLAVLATPGEPVPLPATPPTATLTVTAPRNVTFQLELYTGGVIARKGEPIALRIGEGSFAILARAGAAYVDTTLWSEEPTMIRSIQIGGTTLTRGAVIGEWTSSAGTVDAATVDQLAARLASPRSLGDAPALTNPRPVILTIAPPNGAPFERKLLLGGPRCAATTTNGNTVLLEAQICALATRIK